MGEEIGYKSRMGFSRIACLLLPSALCAQGQISPVTVSSTTAGSTSATIPFASGTARHYQQLHGDVGALTVSTISFRQNEGNTVNFTGTRTIDLELWIANSTVSALAPSTTFASNYSSPPTQGIVRKVVSFGPQGPNVATGGAPFAGMDLVLDAPFVRATSSGSLVWEAIVYSNLGSGSFNGLDADQGASTVPLAGFTAAGCIPGGKTATMTMGLDCADMGGALSFGVSVVNAPTSTTCVAAFGATNPDQAVPGLCSNLLTDLAAVLPMPNTNASGNVLGDAGFGFSLPNAFANVVLFCQIHALDTARTDPIQVCNSNGLKVQLPVPNLTKPVLVSRIYNTVGGTGATNGIFQAANNVGYGLVTWFH